MADEATTSAAPATTEAAKTSDAATVVAPATPARPDFLEPQFKTIEEQAKAYTPLRKKMDATRPATSPPASPTALPPAPEKSALPDDAGLMDMVKAAGLQPEEIGKTFIEKGALTDAMYSALKAQGIPKGAVNEYLTATVKVAQAERAALESKVDALVGGAAARDNLLQWGSQNITDSEKAWYTTQAASGAEAALKAFEWLAAKHKDAVTGGKTAPLAQGGSAPAPTGPGFSTNADLVAAQKDKRYGRDMTYTKEVRKRIGQTADAVIHNRQ